MPVANEIYYHIYEDRSPGEKLPVVLLHGAGGNHLHWPSDVRRMTGFRVYALDLPGHGKSGGRGLQSVQAYADTVLDWMTAAGLHRAALVGHSMGSAIALALALAHPDHVSALGLLGAGARLQVNPALLENAASSTTYQTAISMVVSWSFSPEAPSQLVEQAARRMADTRPTVLHGDFLACDGFDLTTRVAEIGQPTLVICGEDDKMTPRRHAQYLASALPDARLEVIPGAGHMVMLEKPQQVAGLLAGFLAMKY